MALVWSISSNEYKRTICLEFVPPDAAVVPSVSLVAPDCIERIMVPAMRLCSRDCSATREMMAVSGGASGSKPQPITALTEASETWQTSRK